MPAAGTYDVGLDYGIRVGSDDMSAGVFWILAVVRLGTPLSFSRTKMKSVTNDVTQGALLRADKPLVITDDCFSLQVSGGKKSHTKQLQAVLKQSDVNYLVEVLPGDHVMAWIVNTKEAFESLLVRLERGEACNKFDDGLKFVGRVSSIRKQMSVDRSAGSKTSSYSLMCTGFQELDTMLFYDPNLNTKDVISDDANQWLARLGLDMEDLFGRSTENGIEENNINKIIPTMIDLIVGKGPRLAKRSDASIELPGAGGKTVSTAPSLSNEAPYSYLIPVMVGQLLGKRQTDASKPAKILSYADILELMTGVQEYGVTDKDAYKIFVPAGSKTGNRFICEKKMLGTFLPMPPSMCNRPLWSILQQYLNPTINEMYTCLRVNMDGDIVPTLVLRQIPFTTEGFTPDAKIPGSTSAPGTSIPYTKFLNVPRWIIPKVMVSSVDIGRSDATRINFVHIYGQSSLIAKNTEIQTQMLESPPIMDSLDIMRAGMRSYMTSVECWVDDQVGGVPGQWMALVADWTMGSQYTLNGTLTCLGIQSPICEGDNIEFDGVVYHIESVSHSVSGDMNGNRTWTTTLQLTNGMRADVATVTQKGVKVPAVPIYPGFDKLDNTLLDPGLSLDQRATTGGDTDESKIGGVDRPDAVDTEQRRQDLEDKPSQFTQTGGRDRVAEELRKLSQMNVRNIKGS